MFSNINSNYVVMTTVAIVVVLTLAFFVRLSSAHSALVEGAGVEIALSIDKLTDGPRTYAVTPGGSAKRLSPFSEIRGLYRQSS
jgi:hypothetical protein